MESPSDTIKRQSATIEHQNKEIDRLQKEADAWKEKYIEAIESVRKVGLLTE